MSVAVKKIFNGPINGEQEVTIDLTKEQAEELKKALALVRNYEKQALKAAKISKKESDWIMVDYTIQKGGYHKLIVNIQDGACG